MVLSQGVLEHADALTLDSPKTYLRPTVASASKSRTNNASHSHTKRGSAEARYGMSPAAKPVRHKTPPKKQTPIERSPFKPLDLITRRQSLPPPCPFDEADSMRDDENSLRANESPTHSPAKAKPATQAVAASPLRPGLLSPVHRPANTKVNAQWISYYVKRGRLAEARKLGWEEGAEGAAAAAATPQPPGEELHESSEDRAARRASQGTAWTSPAAVATPAAAVTPGSEQQRAKGGEAFFVQLDAEKHPSPIPSQGPRKAEAQQAQETSSRPEAKVGADEGSASVEGVEGVARVAGLAHWQALASEDSSRTEAGETALLAEEAELQAEAEAEVAAAEPAAEEAVLPQGTVPIASAASERAGRPRR